MPCPSDHPVPSAQVTELARITAQESEQIAERQRQLQQQTADLLRGATSERPAGGAGRGAHAAFGSGEPEAVMRANYTASGLGAFTIPLMATRAAGLGAERIANIEAATLATTAHATTAAIAEAVATGDAPAA